MLTFAVVLLDQQYVVALKQLRENGIALGQVCAYCRVVVICAQAEIASAEIGWPSSAIKARSTEVRMQVKLGVSRSV